MKAGMRPPEAIVLDLLLPDGSGLDVCRELRGWSSAPILVLSAVGGALRNPDTSFRFVRRFQETRHTQPAA